MNLQLIIVVLVINFGMLLFRVLPFRDDSFSMFCMRKNVLTGISVSKNFSADRPCMAAQMLGPTVHALSPPNYEHSLSMGMTTIVLLSLTHIIRGHNDMFLADNNWM